jgi:pyrroline-5-carboxylate reductase
MRGPAGPVLRNGSSWAPPPGVDPPIHCRFSGHPLADSIQNVDIRAGGYRMKKIGIIGYGNMGAAIAEGAKSLFAITVFDKDTSKTANALGLSVARSIKELIEESDVLILAVKPQDFDAILGEIKKFLTGQVVISIAAGITTQYIESRLGKAHVIRVMPNMPAQIGKGVSGLCKGRQANEEDFNLAWQLFECVGHAIALDSESMIDAITAISGSGPAFYCYSIKSSGDSDSTRSKFITEVTRMAIQYTFDPQIAKTIVQETADGTACLLREFGWTCEDLMKKVASKGGTTEAGLKVLENGGSLAEAVDAAFKRAKEMNK